MHGFQTLVAAQAAKKGGGYLAALSCQNLWLSCCVGLFMGTLWKKSLVFWNWIIRTCKKFKLCGGVIKTKPSYKCFSNGVPNIEGLFPSTVAFIKKCAGYFFFFKKSVWSEGNRKPRGAPVVWGRPKEVTWKCCLLWGGADWLCRLVLCMHVLVCGNPARAISWCVSISQTNLELSNAFFFLRKCLS